eukprot:365102-Chlamydomonas_euryale.AAC.1
MAPLHLFVWWCYTMGHKQFCLWCAWTKRMRAERVETHSACARLTACARHACPGSSGVRVSKRMRAVRMSKHNWRTCSKPHMLRDTRLRAGFDAAATVQRNVRATKRNQRANKVKRPPADPTSDRRPGAAEEASQQQQQQQRGQARGAPVAAHEVRKVQPGVGTQRAAEKEVVAAAGPSEAQLESKKDTKPEAVPTVSAGTSAAGQKQPSREDTKAAAVSMASAGSSTAERKQTGKAAAQPLAVPA